MGIVTMSQSSQIVDFFSGKVIFLTGCTGFLGKLILERLLRICKVQLVYILVRPKKGKSEEERFKAMFDVPPMEPLKNEQPRFLDKIKLIPGDIVLKNLGISEDNWSLLYNEVQIVIHCAATVRFDQDLRTAYNINVRGTQDLVLNARKMTQLKSFVHVSTAYSNCPRPEVLEQIYDPPLTARQLGIFLEGFKDDVLVKRLTPLILGEWPNTYSFTKCISEDLVYTLSSEEGPDVSPLPVSIIRPSIILSTYKEPIPGWVDNLYGPIGVSYATSLGLLRSLRCSKTNSADMVPADYVVNATLALAWTTANRKDNKIEVYNYTSNEHSINWKIYMEKCIETGLTIVSINSLWVMSLHLHEYDWLHNIHWFLVHTIPAHIVDLYCRIVGKPPLLVDGYQKIRRFANVIRYFTIRKWSFPHHKINDLWKTFNTKDKELFELRISTFNWDNFMLDYVKGARMYLGNESIDNLPAAKKKYFKLQIAHWTIVSLIWLGVAYFGYVLLRLF